MHVEALQPHLLHQVHHQVHQVHLISNVLTITRYFNMITYLLPLGEECTASAPKDKSCCNKKAEKCGENEGDCDKDSHCKAGLKCGNDNCPSGFPSNYDCCYNPSPSGPPSGTSLGILKPLPTWVTHVICEPPLKMIFLFCLGKV